MPVEPERMPKKQAIEELADWIPEIDKMDLTLKQMRFVAAYIGNNFNATEAYHACNSTTRYGVEGHPGCNQETAAKKGCGMLKHPKVELALAAYMKAFIGENKSKMEFRILNQLVLRAFYDPFDIITVTGALRPINEIPEDHRQLIIGVESMFHPKDPSITLVKVKLADRDKARVELEKYINMANKGTTASSKMTDETKHKLRAILGDKKASVFTPLAKQETQTLSKIEV